MDGPFSRLTLADKWFTVINYTVLTLLFLIVAYPLVLILSSSFSSPFAVTLGKVWLYPVDFSLEGYRAVFEQRGVIVGFRNTMFYTVVGTLLNVFMTIAAAYPLSRKDFYGKNVIMFLFVFTMMFSGGMIPTYLLVRDLGLLDTPWAMIIPGAMGVWNVIITRTYFQTTIPQEMLEAAQIDGCNDFKFVWKIVIPLSGPIIAVITLFCAVGNYNKYFDALLYLKNPNLFPLQIALREVLIVNVMDPTLMAGKEAAEIEALHDSLKYALIVVSSFPVLVIYPFVQKHFVKGMMIGSLKG